MSGEPASGFPDPAVKGPARLQQVKLRAIFLVFLQCGAVSFGGGISSWVFREVVQQRGWLSDDEFLSGYALAQVMPGANVANLSVYIGQRLRGAAGAACALAGLLVIPFIALIALTVAYATISAWAWVPAALEGAAAAALGLFGALFLRAGRRAAGSVQGAVVLIATFLAVGVLGWPLVPVVMVIAPVSIAWAWPREKRHAP